MEDFKAENPKRFKQKEDYLQKYWVIWRNSFFTEATDQQIKDYNKAWFSRRKDIVNELGLSSELGVWISFFVKKIYLQPLFYIEAVNLYPDYLPYDEKIIKRFKFLYQNTQLAKDKFYDMYRSFSLGTSNTRNEKYTLTFNDIKKIVFFTENLLREIPHYLYDSPIMIDFITSMFDIKKLYDFEKENNGLPKMNRYFERVDILHFQVDDSKTINKPELSHKEVNIILHLKGVPVTENNYQKEAKTYLGKIPSKKFLAVRHEIKELTKSRGDKTANTKHLESLLKVLEVMKGEKNKKAISSINDIIKEFKAKID